MRVGRDGIGLRCQVCHIETQIVLKQDTQGFVEGLQYVNNFHTKNEAMFWDNDTTSGESAKGECFPVYP